MRFPPHIVAFDTGIYRAGLFSSRPLVNENLAPFLLDAARAGVFTLMFLDSVFDELMRQGERSGNQSWMQDTLIDFFCSCGNPPIWPPEINAYELSEHKQDLWSALRHEADAVVAVEVLKHQPDYFVHCNPAHWTPSVEARLGGVRVVTPREFVDALRLPAPPPPGKRRSR